MIHYTLNNVPNYLITDFKAVRSVYDNLHNILQATEILIYFNHCRVNDYRNGFDLVLLSGGVSRVIIRKDDGFTCMMMPFQTIDNGDSLEFVISDFAEIVDGKLISIMRNALTTVQSTGVSADGIAMSISESFGLDIVESYHYCDVFFHLVSEDHGYFRFDDDIDNVDGKIHPRYHFDFFLKNSSALKIGLDAKIDLEAVINMLDPMKPKWYLRE